ncbi:MAG: YdcH family protein [Hyphomicrobiaceae bacterium]
MEHSDENELRERLAQLRAEHRELDSRIAAIEATTPFDQISITRLKKRKLQLKDIIASLEDRLFPDIIA